MKKRNISLLFLSFVFLCFTVNTLGQEDVELLQGGNMEDESAWTVYQLNSSPEADYEFNYAHDIPSKGSGGCLYVTGSTSEEINILFWQEVTLIGGGTYTITGAFMDLTGGDLVDFWTDVDLSPEPPVESVNYKPSNDTNGDIRVSMNTWAGCGPSIDGTFQDDGCSGTGSEFTVPDSIPVGQEVTYYFGIKPGIYGGGTERLFEILIDEMSLVGPAGASKIKNSPISEIKEFKLHANYPNPFNPSTQISYSLKENIYVFIGIYNINGQLVRILVEKRQPAGTYWINWDGRDYHRNLVSNGIYFCQMQTGSYVETRKMVLTK